MLVLEISLIAANLRAAVTVVGPLLGTISRHYGLSGAEAGVLTALPVLGFAAFSPYALRLSRRVGMNGALLLAMLVLAGGIVLRSLPSVAALFAGSVTARSRRCARACSCPLSAAEPSIARRTELSPSAPRRLAGDARRAARSLPRRPPR